MRGKPAPRLALEGTGTLMRKIDQAGASCRLSFDLYNTVSDVDQAVAAVAAIAGGRQRSVRPWSRRLGGQNLAHTRAMP